MTVHTDTDKLKEYNARNTPNIPGGEAVYLSTELTKISNAVNKLVEVVKMLEARMNTNGLT